MTAKTKAELARMALLEAGRPDLAIEIGTNKKGDPTRPAIGLDESSAELVVKAMALSWGESPDIELWRDFVCQLGRSLHRGHPPHWSPDRQEWVDEYDPTEWRASYD